MYVCLHCTVLFSWLRWGSSPGYPLGDCIFWAFIFGIPHILTPVMLCCNVAHIIRLFVDRVEIFKEDVKSNSCLDIYSADKLFDTFQQVRLEAQELCDELNLVSDWFPLLLGLAIALQGVAVFQFAGEMFSLVYLVQNIICLLSMVWECQKITGALNELMEVIVNLPTDSVLGALGSIERSNMLLTIQRPQSIPAIAAFGYAFSIENFQNIFLFSFGVVGSFVWNQLEEVFTLTNSHSYAMRMAQNTTSITEAVAD